jgi:hypothetical protein
VTIGLILRKGHAEPIRLAVRSRLEAHLHSDEVEGERVRPKEGLRHQTVDAETELALEGEVAGNRPRHPLHDITDPQSIDLEGDDRNGPGTAITDARLLRLGRDAGLVERRPGATSP